MPILGELVYSLSGAKVLSSYILIATEKEPFDVATCRVLNRKGLIITFYIIFMITYLMVGIISPVSTVYSS